VPLLGVIDLDENLEYALKSVNINNNNIDIKYYGFKIILCIPFVQVKDI
jgi:hypothetical protein